METVAGESVFRWRRPWRSAALGWTVTALALVAGVPLLLCMPPWNDVTLHDMAARSILQGGTHYRDVFDTNLPGIDWAMALVRLLFGWSYEVLRAADLFVIGAAVAVLGGWAKRAGGAGYAVAWFAAAVALWYPFTSEFSHVQRDPWMLLPAVLAARLRLQRVGSAGTNGRHFRLALLEGLAWGCAVWVKPHVLVPALAVWLASAFLLVQRESRRAIARDLLALVAGGLLAAAPGVVWLVATGAWPYFIDIFLNWNPAYLSESFPLGVRVTVLITAFGPWSLLHLLALPFALRTLREARTARPGAHARAILAALYLGWLVQVVFVQKPFDYAHVPLLLLAMGVLASRGWCFGFAYLVWFIAVGVLVQIAPSGVSLYSHPLSHASTWKLWPRCWTEGSSPELRDTLGHYTNTPWGTNWRELSAVADYLRRVEPPPGPGELNCWHDTTHPLYLMLDLDPATRYMHYGTAYGIRSEAKRAQISAEVTASRQRFVVADLMRATRNPRVATDPLPALLPPQERAKFPWNQTPVFRAGRYVVFRVDQPLGEVRVPDWAELE